MAINPAAPAPRFAAPAPSPSFHGCDQLVDLLWFYGCTSTTPAPVDRRIHPACAEDIISITHCTDIKSIQSLCNYSAPQDQENINRASIQPMCRHRMLCEGSCSANVSDIYLHQQPEPKPLRGANIGIASCSDRDQQGSKHNIASIPHPQQHAAAPLPSAEWLRRVFDIFDENRDGLVSTEELRRFLEKLGFETSTESIHSLLSYSLANNQKDIVSQDDFFLLYYGPLCALCGSHHSINSDDFDCTHRKQMNEDDADEELIWEAFNVFDKDKDGFISPTELQSVLCSLGFRAARQLDVCVDMIRGHDQDGDGQVDFEEFKAMLNSAINNKHS